ncbi:MAG: hypothetical protein Q8K59_06135 [Nitrosomonas sp.]|nr:hypothetical protein [Nitrosomonas sp.]MDP1950662.1 hypothetical protein [Nitrosomonas sp.]
MLNLKKTIIEHPIKTGEYISLQQYRITMLTYQLILFCNELNLETSVGRGGVCGFWGAGQGAATQDGCSIPRSCNAAKRRKNRAIHPVAYSPIG